MNVLKNVSLARYIAAAIAFTFITFVIHLIGGFAGLKYYQDPAYSAVWSKIFMPSNGPPPAEFTMYSLILGFIVALIFVFIYCWLKPFFKEKSNLKAGITYGLVVFLVGSIPSLFMIWLLVNIPSVLIFSIGIEDIAANVAGGIVIAKIARTKLSVQHT